MVLSRQRVHLHDWQVQARSKDAPENVKSWLPALSPPSTIHQDLLAQDLIPNPFLAKQEEDVQWVGEQQWAYRTTFPTPEAFQKHPGSTAHLVFEGLDTYATVWLNGKRILDADNMFLTYRVDISGALLSHGKLNHMEITFDDAEKRGDEEVAAHPDQKWMTFNSGEARLATRKAQYHYGWDWGPKLMTCGIWRPVYVEIFRSRITDLSMSSSISSDHMEAKLLVNVETQGSAKDVLLSVELEGKVVASRTVQAATAGSTSVTFKISKPELWWPHTFGKQPLYHIKATLLSDGEICDRVIKRIGIRKVELVRKPFANEEGSSFYFRINDTPIFCGGSNWIPGDSLLPRLTPSRYRKWVDLAKASNQVMIRVWGGGIYEDPAFYAACDEAGILVWQDFMFACGMFPAYDSFVARIRPELEDNVRKLRHHPCIVLWCGNNEDYVIPLISNIEYDAGETDPHAILRSDFPARYIYEHLMPEICAALAPGVPYWPGSPFGGEMVNAATEGDIHQWHVWHMEKFPYQDFPTLAGRFVSEFGMQGMPCLRTCRDYFPPDDRLESGRDYAGDEFVEFHNKCVGGPETLHEYCEANIALDTRDLRRYIHATQLIQSETVATAYRSWRRLLRGEGKEYCGGALIWQLNDLWPVTSWALVDSYLRPKMAYWTMKRENTPITAGLQRTTAGDDPAKLDVWAVNTSIRDVHVEVRLRAWKVAGGEPVVNQILHHEVKLPANQSTELNTLELSALGLPSGNGYKDIVLAVDLLASQRAFNPNFPHRIPDKGTVVAQNISFHEPLKEVPFVQTSSLHVDILREGGGFVVEIESAVALKGVLLEVHDSDLHADEVSWAENGFDLLPEETMKVGVEGLKAGEEHRLRISWLGGQWAPSSTDGIKSVL